MNTNTHMRLYMNTIDAWLYWFESFFFLQCPHSTIIKCTDSIQQFFLSSLLLLLRLIVAYTHSFTSNSSHIYFCFVLFFFFVSIHSSFHPIHTHTHSYIKQISYECISLFLYIDALNSFLFFFFRLYLSSVLFGCYYSCRHYNMTESQVQADLLKYITSFSFGILWVKHTKFMLCVSPICIFRLLSWRSFRILFCAATILLWVTKLKSKRIEFCDWRLEAMWKEHYFLFLWEIKQWNEQKF